MRSIFIVVIIIQSFSWQSLAQEKSLRVYSGIMQNYPQSNVRAFNGQFSYLFGNAIEFEANKQVRINVGLQWNNRRFEEPNQRANGRGIITYDQYQLIYLQLPLAIHYSIGIRPRFIVYPLLGYTTGWLLVARRNRTEFDGSELVIVNDNLPHDHLMTNRLELSVNAGLGFRWCMYRKVQLFTELHIDQAISNWYGDSFISGSQKVYNRNAGLQLISGFNF